MERKVPFSVKKRGRTSFGNHGCTAKRKKIGRRPSEKKRALYNKKIVQKKGLGIIVIGGGVREGSLLLSWGGGKLE